VVFLYFALPTRPRPAVRHHRLSLRPSRRHYHATPRDRYFNFGKHGQHTKDVPAESSQNFPGRTKTPTALRKTRQGLRGSATWTALVRDVLRKYHIIIDYSVDVSTVGTESNMIMPQCLSTLGAVGGFRKWSCEDLKIKKYLRQNGNTGTLQAVVWV
jgi:hypothetical protein